MSEIKGSSPSDSRDVQFPDDLVKLANLLHDGLCQDVTGTALLAKVLASRLAQENHRLTGDADKIVELLQKITGEVRVLIQTLGRAGR